MKIEFSDQALAARIFSCANSATNIAPVNNAHPVAIAAVHRVTREIR
jgi:hypothetical protein